MTDRAKELVDEFSKTMDARTYDEKNKAMVYTLADYVFKLERRVVELESKLKMLENQQGTM